MKDHIEYYSSGEIMCKGCYLNERAEGVWIWYNKTGSVEYKGQYIKGKRDGIWIEYFSSGEVRSEYYISGIQITEKEWLIHCNLELIVK